MGTQEKLEDDSLMPYGKYKGDPMINIPASYLIWLLDNDKCSSQVRWYIEENMDALKEELK